jgi:hypothetical protein
VKAWLEIATSPYSSQYGFSLRCLFIFCRGVMLDRDCHVASAPRNTAFRFAACLFSAAA